MQVVSKLALTAGTMALAIGIAAGGGAVPAMAGDNEQAAPVSIVRAPDDIPGPIGERENRTVRLTLETTEVVGRLDDGTSFRYWTFNDTVPGPFVRVKQGDTVQVTLENAEGSWMYHSVDFHAVTGPGGGAVATQTAPGEARTFSFKALKPGLYVYHCATPMVAQHIANGMYGMILVEPKEGLPEVDREFYVMQGEIYTEQELGTRGQLTESYEKLLDEQPEYYVFNGAVGALSDQAPLKAKVGETVRIYFGVGGPNKTSSFHVIGEIMDKVYNLGSLATGPVEDVQTVSVAPGGATVAEVSFEVPGEYLIVDHALSRLARGLVARIDVEGPANPKVFKTRDQVAAVE
ncbi:copper-containing nitrite reductase [Ferruginivarius sediminum]|uniref:Copper-containing nitrite reductase n=1 Tax=Ferruginivarius sediminum TaxID=2661937 RepID=A0A369T806_9PROT|nr:copper-containing nitrite reductase [Ferruginivarius sediminum]RDD61440.1 nitrite reductase, copper-containing [Ferruginivarius sediminum]